MPIKAERNRGRIRTVTFVCVAVGLLVAALLLMLLGVGFGEFSGPLLGIALVLAASGLILIAAMWGGVYDPSFGWIWQTPFGGSGFIGCEAEVRAQDMVFINGALWKAECEESPDVGEKFGIVDTRGFVLKVQKLQ